MTLNSLSSMPHRPSPTGAYFFANSTIFINARPPDALEIDVKKPVFSMFLLLCNTSLRKPISYLALEQTCWIEAWFCLTRLSVRGPATAIARREEDYFSWEYGRAKRFPTARSGLPLRLRRAACWQHCRVLLLSGHCQVSPDGIYNWYFYMSSYSPIRCSHEIRLSTCATYLAGENNGSSFTLRESWGRDLHVIRSRHVVTQSLFCDLIGRRNEIAYTRLPCMCTYCFAHIFFCFVRKGECNRDFKVGEGGWRGGYLWWKMGEVPRAF